MFYGYILYPYRCVNKQVEQLSEFINIKWMFTHVWNSFEWSSKLKCKLWGQDSNYWPMLVLCPVRATNYGRWCSGDFSQTGRLTGAMVFIMWI